MKLLVLMEERFVSLFHWFKKDSITQKIQLILELLTSHSEDFVPLPNVKTSDLNYFQVLQSEWPLMVLSNL